MINNPPEGWHSVQVEVFNAVTPVAWTDLDLSGVVGAKQTLAILKVMMPTFNEAICFRKNGDADEHYTVAPSGAGNLGNAADIFQTVVIPTDNVGIIEWRSSGARANTTVDVIGFI